MKTTKLVFLFLSLFVASCAREKNILKTQQTEKENLLDGKNLVALLDTIWRTEQEPIQLRDSLGRVHGYESEEFQ